MKYQMIGLRDWQVRLLTKDLEFACQILRYSSCPGNLTFQNILPELCIRLKTLASDDDTLSAISYALWELGFPRSFPESPDIVDFLSLGLRPNSQDPSVHNYAAMLLEDYVAIWKNWTPHQYKKIINLSHTSSKEDNQTLFRGIAKRVTV